MKTTQDNPRPANRFRDNRIESELFCCLWAAGVVSNVQFRDTAGTQPDNNITQ